MKVEEKTEKTRADAERRNAGDAEFLAANAIWKSTRRKINSLTAEQKADKAMAGANRYRKPRLNVEQKGKNVRIETEKRNAESFQAAFVRLIDKCHRYDTRFATVADSVVANASISNNVLNV